MHAQNPEDWALESERGQKGEKQKGQRGKAISLTPIYKYV